MSREDAASLVAWAMICRLDVIPRGRSRLKLLGIANSAVTEDLAWADDPAAEIRRRRSWYLRRTHAEAVDTLYRIATDKVASPYKWIRVEMLSLAPLSLIEHIQELSFRLRLMTWPFTLWRQLSTTYPSTRESVVIRASLLADELDRAAQLDERTYSVRLLHQDAAYIERLVDLLLTIATGPPASARMATRLLARLCCHSPAAWEQVQRHVRGHPLGHRNYVTFARMLSLPWTPSDRAKEISTWLLESPDEHAARRHETRRRCWNVQHLSCEALGLLPTTHALFEDETEDDGQRAAAGRLRRSGSRVDSDVDFTGSVLPSGLWPPDRRDAAEAGLRRRTTFVVTRLREQARDDAARRGADPSPIPDLVSERLNAQALNSQLSWRVRALAADSYRTHRPGSFKVVTDRPPTGAAGSTRSTGGLSRRIRRIYRGSMSDLLNRFEHDISAGLDPSGGLAHALAVFEALESAELSRPGRRPALAPTAPTGHVPDNQLLRRSPAISHVLERILDDVIPDSRGPDAEHQHRVAFTDSIRNLVEGLDPSIDLHGEHSVPSEVRRGIRGLIRTMLGSLDAGRERRAVSTLVAAGMTVPTMCVLNQLLRADLDGEIANHRASFLTEQTLMYLGHLGENPLAGVVVLRWLDRRWLEWRAGLRDIPLRQPVISEIDDQVPPWPSGDALARYVDARHRLELLHTAVWALGDIKWDAMADESARLWLRERWKRGVVLLFDVATYGLADVSDFEEHVIDGTPCALAALREAAYYVLAVTRWEHVGPDEAEARHELVNVAGALRRRYSHDGAGPVVHARPIPDHVLSPAEIAQFAVQSIEKVTVNGSRPPVLEHLQAWRADYRRLVFPRSSGWPG